MNQTSTSLSAKWGNQFSPQRPNSWKVVDSPAGTGTSNLNTDCCCGLTLCSQKCRSHVPALSKKPSDSRPSEPRKPDITLSTPTSAEWTLGPRERYILAQVTPCFVSGKTRTTLTAFLCPALTLLMWSQANGRMRKRGEAREQQEPSLSVVSKLTNHIRLKYDTRSCTWKRGDIFT